MEKRKKKKLNTKISIVIADPSDRRKKKVGTVR